MARCDENRRWTYRGVTYATLNIQGSCNNLCDTAPDPLEYAARNQAVIAWMRETFAEAKSEGSAAVMLISQADPGWDAADATRAPLRNATTLVETDGAPDGYRDFLLALREEVTAFRRPLAYVHGDSHYFRIDRPLLDTLAGGLKTSRVSKRSVTTRPTATMTCNGSRSRWTRARARSSRIRRRSCPPTA
jgi:hypothetical protein